jgi:hypothetical protein
VPLLAPAFALLSFPFPSVPGPRGNRQSWRHLDEVGRSASRAPDNKPGQRDEREYLEYLEKPVPFELFQPEYLK